MHCSLFVYQPFKIKIKVHLVFGFHVPIPVISVLSFLSKTFLGIIKFIFLQRNFKLGFHCIESY
jgi:hypothetical protein